MENNQPDTYKSDGNNSSQKEVSSYSDGVSSENAEPLSLSQNLSGINEICVYNHKTDSVFVMPLEEYVASVVVAEMPASSPSQALKAQAVAVRTLAVNYILDNDKSEHKGADICT
ncbi:MAG: SpoIID/LytB domain-containing protein, partial [Clostridia bacterium]|nr:SpoIID/LytB domain-containing protein [Clostridia bacterium]